MFLLFLPERDKRCIRVWWYVGAISSRLLGSPYLGVISNHHQWLRLHCPPGGPEVTIVPEIFGITYGSKE